MALRAIESPLGEDSEKFYINDPKSGCSSDGLLVRLVGVSIISLQVPPVWGLHTVDSMPLLIISFSHLEGVSISANASKILLCISVDGETEPCLKAALDGLFLPHVLD